MKRWWLFVILCSALAGCAVRDRDHSILVSVPDQRMVVFRRGERIAEFPVSTSRFALSDAKGSKGTPLGRLEIARKIGGGAPAGTVFKSRKRTGEILPIDSPGRDPIVTRILWLRGTEGRTANAYGRYIYIHGTPEERNIGKPASYGCIRMRSQDVIALYDTVGVGAAVEIRNEPLAALPPVTVGVTRRH
jgi:lipoprotein-anchoring transpeptidase ErfK/SrfK